MTEANGLQMMIRHCYETLCRVLFVCFVSSVLDKAVCGLVTHTQSLCLQIENEVITV